jgi:hypothetical protein
MGERVTCVCGRNLGATPRGMLRLHTRPGVHGNMVRCPWSGRPAHEVAQCMTGATDERIAKLIYAGRCRYPTVLTMGPETETGGQGCGFGVSMWSIDGIGNPLAPVTCPAPTPRAP